MLVSPKYSIANNGNSHKTKGGKSEKFLYKHHSSGYKVTFRNWTYDLDAYIARAKQEQDIVIQNGLSSWRDHWMFGLTFNQKLPAKDHAKIWKKFGDRIRGVVAINWAREFVDGLAWEFGTPSGLLNPLHYHGWLRLLSDFSGYSQQTQKRKIKQILKTALPKDVRDEVTIMLKKPKTWKDFVYWSGYIYKSKMGGHNRAGVWVSDLWKHKRFLWPNQNLLPLDKIGTIGQYWYRPKGKIRDAIKAEHKAWHDAREAERTAMLASATDEQIREAKVISSWMGDDFDYVLSLVLQTAGIDYVPFSVL